MAQVFEMIMLICFGLSWPFNITKSVRSRTAKGKSLWFEVCIIVGSLCGLAGTFISGNVTYVAAFYILDFTMGTIDLVLTIRNKRLDRAAEKEETVCNSAWQPLTPESSRRWLISSPDRGWKW